MSSRLEVKETVGHISNDGNFSMDQVQTSKRGCFAVRYLVAFILQLCNFSVYSQMMSFSIAMPAMVNTSAQTNRTNGSEEEPLTVFNVNETQEEIKAMAPVYDWSPQIQGIILGSVNYGSFFTPLLSGYISGIYGAKYAVGVGLCISSVLTLFIPLATNTGVVLLILLRIVQGITQVNVLTSQYSIWIKWAPPLERNKLITIAMSGSSLGCLLIFLLGGVICQTVGWPYIFYIFGTMGCVCSLLWLSLVSEKPMNHPFISTAEKEYIECSLTQEDAVPHWSVPIKDMLKSTPLWTILISNFCESWHNHIILSYLAIYINSVLQVDLQYSGFLSSLPFVLGYFCIILEGQLADLLHSRKLLKLITIRKLFTAVGVLSSGTFILSMNWVRSSQVTLAFLILSCIFNTWLSIGVMINMMDIAPRYAAFLKGLAVIFEHIAGAISPTVSGYLCNQDSESSWSNIFFLSTAIRLVGLIIYLIFGKAEVQDWAREQSFT